MKTKETKGEAVKAKNVNKTAAGEAKPKAKVKQAARGGAKSVKSSSTSAKPKACAVYYVNDNPIGQSRLVLSIRSLARHTPADLDIVVMCDSKLDAVQEALSGYLCGHRYRELHTAGECLKEQGITDKGWNRIWPFGVLYRLVLPLHPFFQEYDRVLYMDVDVLVSSDNAASLLTADLSRCEIRAAPDVPWLQNRIREVYENDILPENVKRLRRVLGDDMIVRPYVNAGVLLWNLPEIRKDLQWYKDRLAMFWEAECRGKFGYLDQDFINTMMVTRADLSPRMNTIVIPNNGARGDLTHYVGAQCKEMIADAFSQGLFMPPVPPTTEA